MGKSKTQNSFFVIVVVLLVAVSLVLLSRDNLDIRFSSDGTSLEEEDSGSSQQGINSANNVKPPINSVPCSLNLGPEIRLTNDAESSIVPSIATDSLGNNHIIWIQQGPYNLPPYNAQVYYMKVNGNGVVIQPKTLLKTLSTIYYITNQGQKLDPSLLIDSQDNVHIFGKEKNQINNGLHLYYMKLDRNGNILIPDMSVTSVTENTQTSYQTGEAVDSIGNAYAVYQKFMGGGAIRDELFLIKIDINGNVQTPVRLTWSSPNQAGHNGFGNIVIDSQNKFHVTWVNKSVVPYSQQLNYQVFDSALQPLTPVRVIGFSPSAIQYYDESSLLKDFQNNIHSFWSEYHQKIAHTKFNALGNLLVPAHYLADYGNTIPPLDSSYESNHYIDTNNRIHTVSRGQTYFGGIFGPIEIYYSLTDSLGSTIYPTKQISFSRQANSLTGLAVNPSVSGKGNGAYVVWQDARDAISATDQNTEIYLRIAQCIPI